MIKFFGTSKIRKNKKQISPKKIENALFKIFGDYSFKNVSKPSKEN